MGANYGGFSMFFAGLILLIPHRIGMSRVNYVIKRYNLPISRAGLLLYKFHNPIEVSLTIGTLFGNVIVWCVGSHPSASNQDKNVLIKWSMIFFVSLMFLSSIFMYIIYVSGDDYGHLDHFYFSLILITLFDGFSNAFAFAINGINASMLAAGIPTSGALVSLIHNLYKFISDSFHWDDFDYYVLFLQLFFNIITLLITSILWSNFEVGSKAPTLKIMELFNTEPKESTTPNLREDAHICDWFPICMLAISLGTVYAFYPSIAPYSIIDYQYASVIELWILVISAIPTLVIAILDQFKFGPSGYVNSVTSTGTVSFSTQTTIEFTGNELEVKHTDKTAGPGATAYPKVYHSSDGSDECQNTASHGSGGPQFHAYKSSGPVTYNISAGNDKYWDKDANNGQGEAKSIPTAASETITLYYDYQDWFQKKITLTPGTGASPSNLQWSDTNGKVEATSYTDDCFWNLIWFCAIFYILCIQIFMSMLHYPDCLLYCFFNKPLRIGFISVLFNTLRETMQACGFAGAGKQCTNLNHISTSNIKDNVESYDIPQTTILNTNSNPSKPGQVKLTNFSSSAPVSKKVKEEDSTPTPINDAEFQLKAGSTKSFYIPKVTLTNINNGHIPNGSIAATNKLITLFVMMFCVFTGDGYLQHYRRCCRDCWPTTGFNKYQSFFYWLRYGFKGGSKSFTTSFTDMYHRNIRPQIISYA